jgi:hypothetical protein
MNARWLQLQTLIICPMEKAVASLTALLLVVVGGFVTSLAAGISQIQICWNSIAGGCHPYHQDRRQGSAFGW